jgi:hypothetical protein
MRQSESLEMRSRKRDLLDGAFGTHGSDMTSGWPIVTRNIKRRIETLGYLKADFNQYPGRTVNKSYIHQVFDRHTDRKAESTRGILEIAQWLETPIQLLLSDATCDACMFCDLRTVHYCWMSGQSKICPIRRGIEESSDKIRRSLDPASE